MNVRVGCVAGILIALSLGILASRVSLLKPSVFPKTSLNSWEIEARVVLKDPPKRVKVELNIPTKALGGKILQESFRSMGLAAALVDTTQRRTLIWSGRAEKDKTLTLSYSAVLESGLEGVSIPKAVSKKKSSNGRILFSEEEVPQVKSFLKSILRKKQKGNSAQLLRSCVVSGACANTEFLQRYRSSEFQRARALAALLQMNGLRAYVATGFYSRSAKRGAAKRFWVRTVESKKIVDLFVDDKETLTAEQVVFWSYLGAKKSKESTSEVDDIIYSMVPVEQELFRTPVALEKSRSLAWRILSLRSLPISVQATYRVMLLIPIGALVITLLRSIIGLPTFGTFMPVLIALSFRDTGVLWGMALLSTVVAFGLVVRVFLRKMQLLLVPRLSTTLSVVILLVLLISRIAHEMGLSEGLSVTLFPMVILTMVIERMSISWEEAGIGKTLVLFSNTLLAAVLSFFVMMQSLMQYWMFTFPELTLIIVACTMICGRYTGYRLLELYRFRAFGKGE